MDSVALQSIFLYKIEAKLVGTLKYTYSLFHCALRFVS
jgi:hypothetical protein